MKQRAEKDRISAVLFIVVFLLVVVIVIMVLKTVDDKRAAQNAQEQGTINTQDYQPAIQDPNALVSGDSVVTPNPYTPVNTLPGGNTSTGNSGYSTGNSTGTYPAQAPTTVPANNPAPAPQQQTPTQQAPAANQQTPAQSGGDTAPAEPGAFVPVSIGSGSFESETPTPLNIRADWTATAISETQVEVFVVVNCLHQTLYTGEYNPVNIMVGDQYASIYGTRIRSDSYDYQETKLAERTFTLDLSQGESKNIWINVAYEYGGTYFGVRLDSIECGGNVTLSR